MTNYIIVLGYKIHFVNGIMQKNGAQRVLINTINPHSYVIARKDEKFNEALQNSDILLPDGIGIVLAAAILNRQRIKKISGYDIHQKLIIDLSAKEGRCFYLGSTEMTLEKIKERNKREHPGIICATLSPPFKEEFTKEEDDEIINSINKFNPDVLFVGMTAPKQEKWVYKNRERINAKTICSIGAVFDFYAGTVKRASPFWIKIGMEFLPRLLREPRRLWRRNFISTPLFIYYVLLAFLGLRNNEN